jgi:3-oxoacyl-[acyl-carrier-protein] synthase III
MKIVAVSHSVPSTRVTPDWIVERIRARNEGHLDAGELSKLENALRNGITRAGGREKYTLGADEYAIDIVEKACRIVFSATAWNAPDLDFVIYASVARGALEPATANNIMDRIGASTATGFDLLDACTGWLRALEVARGLLACGRYRRGMIVTCECGLGGLAKWDYNSAAELSPYLATFTMGEAATATLVEQDETDDFHFVFRNYPEYNDLCTIPLPSAKQFASRGGEPNTDIGRFSARSRDLLSIATDKIIEAFHADPVLRDAHYDVAFGHAASEESCEYVRESIGVAEDIYFPTHSGYGNTVSSAVPLGLSLAVNEGKLHKGNAVLVIVGGAGISIGLARFTY